MRFVVASFLAHRLRTPKLCLARVDRTSRRIRVPMALSFPSVFTSLPLLLTYQADELRRQHGPLPCGAARRCRSGRLKPTSRPSNIVPGAFIIEISPSTLLTRANHPFVDSVGRAELRPWSTRTEVELTVLAASCRHARKHRQDGIAVQSQTVIHRPTHTLSRCQHRCRSFHFNFGPPRDPRDFGASQPIGHDRSEN